MFRSHVFHIVLAVAFTAALCGAGAPLAGQSPASQATKTGIDVLEQQNFASLQGKRVGLITNQTGRDAAGHRTIDILAHARGVKLVALFSPEHGIAGSEDTATIANATDAATHLPVFSLYGETRRPTDAMLQNIDVLVFDIQDAGVRFYTYVTTMAYCMEEAAKRDIAFIVLDRPDPIGGEIIEGPMLDSARTSFTGYFPMPVRYAMTIGELAQMFNAENKIGANLHVVAMKNWRRDDAYDRTGLAWVPPSPNLRNLNAAFLYPGIEILQAGGLSVGRGTAAPFEMIGAPWIHADELTVALSRQNIPGVSFAPAQFTPAGGLYSGQPCQGVSITIANRDALRAMQMGLTIAATLRGLYQDRFDLSKTIDLLGSQSTVDRLARADAPAEIIAGWSASLESFRATREKYLLYH